MFLEVSFFSQRSIIMGMKMKKHSKPEMLDRSEFIVNLLYFAYLLMVLFIKDSRRRDMFNFSKLAGW